MTIKQSTIQKCARNLAFSTHDKNNQNHLAYEKDFFKWTKTQANHLKKKEFSKLDIENLIEEIKSLGRSEKRAIKSYLANLLLDLLKIECQPGKHTKS